MTKNEMKAGTAVQLVIGDTILPATLNDSTPAKALLAKLPYVVQLQRYAHDYCGVMDALPYKKEELRSGWSNGDIAFAVAGNYFAILYKDEELSQEYDGMVTMGRLTSPLQMMDALKANISVRIELG